MCGNGEAGAYDLIFVEAVGDAFRARDVDAGRKVEAAQAQGDRAHEVFDLGGASVGVDADAELHIRVVVPVAEEVQIDETHGNKLHIAAVGDSDDGLRDGGAVGGVADKGGVNAVGLFAEGGDNGSGGAGEEVDTGVVDEDGSLDADGGVC